MPIAFEVREAGRTLVIAASGPIVYGPESQLLREQVKKSLEHSRSLVLDLKHVPYVDSGGLGAVIACLTSARAAGGDLRLCGLTERVRHVLTITRLMGIFEIYASAEEAIAAAAHAAA